MSGPVAIADNGERSLSISSRTRSLDSVSFHNSDNNHALTNGETARSSTESVAFRYGELKLPNGEFYSGSLLGNVPEGSGKYVWSSGCKYEGEWRRGMWHGSGKLHWPSGANYEGEFSGGYMQGTGTYIRSDKLVYKGRWRLSRKHGLGYQAFPNGDIFEGSWIQGSPDGPGSWSNGVMHGFGAYTWSDGGRYVGTWTWGLKDGKGAFYPNGCRLPARQELYLKALRKRGLLSDLQKVNQVSRIQHASSIDMGNFKVGGSRSSHRNSSDKFSKENFLNLESRNNNVSLERRWSLEVAIEKVMGHDLASYMSDSGLHSGEDDTKTPILEREYMQGILISELVVDSSFSPGSKREMRRQRKLVKDVKRPGEAIIKGHRSYDLMLSLQLGIRYTVGKITPVQKREVRTADFGPRASFWMNFPKEGSQLTPTHQSEDFKWKDYCPMVFRNLREMFKIDAADYMMSICGNDALRELSSPGKSGSVFFLSQDDRFMIKTLRKSEVQVLLRMLPDYHRHVRTYDNTLITKFFGLHRIKPSSGQKFRFVVMGNMFCTELRIHRRYDLKGSSLGRSADKVEIDENTILKDLDLNYCFYLEPSWRGALLKQIEIDSNFLEAQNIMDYSLLLGVHYRAPQHLKSLMSYNQSVTTDGLGIVAEEESMEDEISPQGLVLVPRGSEDGTVVVGPHIRGSRLRSSATGDVEVDLLLPGTARLQIQLGVNMPARAELLPGEEEKQMFHEVYDVVLYLGIIDILQEYNIQKKIEHKYKSFQFDSLSISAVDPTFYSERFLEFIQKVFPPNGTPN
ncbi:phosphatidylinositol 4-phosphate 5-kinase 9 isoform X2 [Cynara cardunculus var. scolymus]|uniref:phosphatidylinositol 4-phosphate 5-kinase 9 isoform X2 n=1 Tax=Cynara cardunculus var. scolymus TaxID=59895 RepID=UPI000D62CFDF|nr:phosphatidylinositol 4-phosphate 5-kinase 9 isoform X2 [Cynara cardunculus var. scolymus]